MEDQAQAHDPRRLFYSDLKDDNLLDCIVSKVTIVQVSPSVGLHLYIFLYWFTYTCLYEKYDFHFMLQVDEKSQLSPFHYYYDMKYSLDYSTFSNVEMGEFL